MSNDPLLQPFQLKHLTLRNRIMTTSHEPAYGDDGMPKDRYRLYHLERAKAGVAMVMTAGSASVSRDSPDAERLKSMPMPPELLTSIVVARTCDCTVLV